MKGEINECPYCDFWTPSSFLNLHISRMHKEYFPEWLKAR